MSIKSGSTPYETIKKICAIDVSEYDFQINDKLTKMIAQHVRKFVKNPEDMAWKDKTIVWYSKKNWKPTMKFKFEMKHWTENYCFWSVQPAENKVNLDSLTDQEKFLARVIYSETSTICTPFETRLVCKVIMNRIGNPNFANGGETPQNAYDVVNVKNAFSCINDKNNTNWNQFTPQLNEASKRDSVYAYFMMKNDEKTIKLPAQFKDIVYYHDKSIECPKSWTNKYWKPVLVTQTEHFKFYKIVPNSVQKPKPTTNQKPKTNLKSKRKLQTKGK